MSKQSSFVSGAGLGFRRDLLPDLEQHGVPAEAGFFETTAAGKTMLAARKAMEAQLNPSAMEGQSDD